MPAFAYRAVDAAGSARRGTIEAADAPAARAALRRRDLMPVAVEAKGDAPGASFTLPFRRPGRLSPRALATVTRQISTLVGSEVNIEESLRLVAEQADTPAIQRLLGQVRAAILDGRSFAHALAEHPAAFPDFYRASVAAGEQSGRLADVLLHLADFVEARQRNAQKVQLALLYPSLLAVVALGMITLLLIYVVPDIVRVFVSRGADLPLLTRALIATSSFVTTVGPVLLVAGLGGGLLFRRWLARPANRLALDAFWVRRWPIARFSRQHNAARFAGSLATLTLSAVPLVEAIEAAAAVTPNRYIRGKAEGVAARVREGSSLRAAMTEAAVFPSMLVAIVASGESSGRLGPALGRAAAELDRELDAMVSTLVSLVEPAVLLLMGGIVLMMVLAILLPIINLNDLVAM